VPPASEQAVAILERNFVTGMVLYARSLYEASGGYRGPFRCAEDWDLWIRIGLAAPIRADPAVVARYRFDAGRFASAEGSRIAALDASVSRLSASGGVPRSWLRPALRRIHRFRARRASTLAGKLSEWARAIV
jgi:hypothetical protein